MRLGSPRVDERFLLDPFEPAYLSLPRAELERRVGLGLRELEDCCACPRECRVNRLAGETKACRTGRHARVASAFPHFGEEDCLRGTHGSGTIFFAWCNLRCVFCQNWDTSQAEAGRELTGDQVADLMLPIVYNTSAHDSVSSLRLLDGLVDVYMPDFKFWEPDTARRLAKAEDYPARAREAIREMHRQVGDLRFGPDGLARRGLLVRHLVMPGQTAEAAAIFGWLAREISPDTFVNVMGQYRPAHLVPRTADGTGRLRFEEIARPVEPGEVLAARRAARAAGLYRFDERRALA
jgi:putative pyruvate formate lyase activating enzyme